MEIDWIKAGLKRPGKSQRGLARALDIDPSGVSRLLSGDRSLKAAEIEIVRRYLDLPVTPLEGLSEVGAHLELPAIATLDRDLEVRGTAVGGEEGAFDFNGDVVDYLRRPPGLAGARMAFAIYTAGDSMSPRFDEGEIVFVHPGRPAVPGCDVIVELHGRDGEPGHCYIKRLVRRTTAKLVLSQFNPPKEISFSLKQVRAVYRVMTPAELLGV